MSFVFEDEQLLDLLLKYGQAAQGQYFAVSPEDVNAVRAMISNLEQKLTAPTTTTPEITSDVPVSLASPMMKNLSTLINFLYTTGMKVNGKRIVVGSDDLPNDPSYLPFKVEGEQTFRSSTPLLFKVNKGLLTQYLTSLQGHLSATPNPVMKAQVDSMIGEANEQLGTTVGKVYQAPAETLDPRVVVDKVPQRIITKTQLYGDGPIPLTFGNLSSDTTFNSWIQTNKITVDDQPQADQCGVLKFLYNRAVNKVRNATTVQAKSVANLYQKQLTQLAPAFKCDLGGESKQPIQTDRGADAGGPAAILQLAQDLPLALNDIDFTRIENFLSGYETLIGSNTDPRRASQMQTIKTAIEQARSFMQNAQRQTLNGNMSNFPLNGLTSGDLVAWSTPPTTPGQPIRSRGSARALVDYLDYTVRNVASVVQNFYYSYVSDERGQQIFANNHQLVNAVAGQAQVAVSNLNRLGAARERLPQVGA